MIIFHTYTATNLKLIIRCKRILQISLPRVQFSFFFKFNSADLEECATNTHNCDVNADCVNTMGAYSCICRAGYTRDGQTCNGKILKTNKQTNKI